MKKIRVSFLGFFLISLLLFSCSNKEISPMNGIITPKDTQVANIPPLCKKEYRKIINPPKVAVVEFTNNTTFTKASLKDAYGNVIYRGNTIGGGIGVVNKNVGVGVFGAHTYGKADVSLQSITRKVNAKLGKSVAEAVEAYLSEIGNIKVFTRSQLKKILDEQKLQQSGLLDEKTTIQIGKLSGVRYIITGSINNVALKWLSADYLKASLHEELGLVGSVLATAIEAQEGWNVYVELNIKMLDAQTGQVLFSKQVDGRASIGKVPILTYDAVIGGIKLAAKDALNKIKPFLAKYFTVKGYIVKTVSFPKEGKRYALINLGLKQGVKEGEKFLVYTLDVLNDPISGKSKCIKVQLPVNLKVTKYIQDNYSWTLIEGEKKDIYKVKIGHFVEKIVETQGKLSKLFNF